MLLKCLLFVPGTLLMLRLPTIYTAFMTMANLKIYLNGPLFVIFEVCNPLLASMLKKVKGWERGKVKRNFGVSSCRASMDGREGCIVHVFLICCLLLIFFSLLFGPRILESLEQLLSK